MFGIGASTVLRFFAGPLGQCGRWRSFDGDCYHFMDWTPRSWAEGRAECINQGGDLASITDHAHMMFIQGTKNLSAGNEPHAELESLLLCLQFSRFLDKDTVHE